MIVVSHRGPERFERAADGSFERHRGAGGVVSALRPLLAGADAIWVAAAIGEHDRAAVAAGAATSDDFDLHLLALDEDDHRLHYDVVSNAVLWFLHHGLFELPRRPSFDQRFAEAWEAYRRVNAAFASEIAANAPDGEVVLVQDYHLALVPAVLAGSRPDLSVVFFQHTPHCGPNSIGVLPDRVATELLSAMASCPAGFHSPRWARAFEVCNELLMGSPPAGGAFATPLGIDPGALESNAGSVEVSMESAALDALIGDRQAIVRVDRIEPSKNIVRGFRAYDLLLETHPEWRERVVFVALVYPSREGLAEYLAYRQEVEQAAARVNDRWATSGWQPVVLDTDDTYPRSLAGLLRYDVLLVNPIRDGLNLVAKEGAFLNEHDGVVALSREAGAFDELGDAAIDVHPYDIVHTAEALHRGLDMEADERRARSARLKAAACAHTSRDWLDDLVRRRGAGSGSG